MRCAAKIRAAHKIKAPQHNNLLTNYKHEMYFLSRYEINAAYENQDVYCVTFDLKCFGDGCAGANTQLSMGVP